MGWMTRFPRRHYSTTKLPFSAVQMPRTLRQIVIFMKLEFSLVRVRTILLVSLITPELFGSPSSNPAHASDVLTYHNDNARTGQMLTEEILTLANVNSTHFGKLRVLPSNGKVDAEPLYAAGVPIPNKGIRNVLFVASEHDTVYAYDADSTNLFWQVSLLGNGETTSDTRGCSQVSPEIGITATPVIDRNLGS